MSTELENGLFLPTCDPCLELLNKGGDLFTKLAGVGSSRIILAEGMLRVLAPPKVCTRPLEARNRYLLRWRGPARPLLAIPMVGLTHEIGGN